MPSPTRSACRAFCSARRFSRPRPRYRKSPPGSHRSSRATINSPSATSLAGNAFLPTLFLVATLLSGKSVLPQAQAPDIYLTAVGLVLTSVYITGLLFRPTRRIARMGVDSLIVVVLYALAVAGLFAIARST